MLGGCSAERWTYSISCAVSISMQHCTRSLKGMGIKRRSNAYSRQWSIAAPQQGLMTHFARQSMPSPRQFDSLT